MSPDCAALQLTPDECAEYLTPATPPDGAGWLLVAIVLFAILAAIKASYGGDA